MNNDAIIRPTQELSISQVAKLYDITSATLYYYEKIGLLVPERNDANGYRVYADEDFAHLNLVKTLQGMGISLAGIKDYEETHCMSSSIELLQGELRKIGDEIERLRDEQRRIEHVLMRYMHALLEAREETIFDIHIDDRPCIVVCDKPETGSNFSFLYAEKVRTEGLEYNVFDLLPTYAVDPKANESGAFTPVKYMLYSETPTGAENGIIPAGRYLSITFKGSILRTPEIYERVVAYAQEYGLDLVGHPIEFWTINEYTTTLEEEFIHVLEQRVIDSKEEPVS